MKDMDRTECKNHSRFDWLQPWKAHRALRVDWMMVWRHRCFRKARNSGRTDACQDPSLVETDQSSHTAKQRGVLLPALHNRPECGSCGEKVAM